MSALAMVFPVFSLAELHAVVCFLGCLSTLPHFGHHRRFVLSSRKEDDNPMLYRDIVSMKHKITLYYYAKKGIGNTTFDVTHSTPLGKSSIELMLSALAVVSEESS